MNNVDRTQSNRANDPESSPGNAGTDTTQPEQAHVEGKDKSGGPELPKSKTSWRRCRIAWRRTKWHDRIIAGAAVAAVVVAGIQLGVYIQMKGIMESSSGQTDQLIKAAKTQACAAQRFANSAEEIDKGVGAAVTKLNLQAQRTLAQVSATNQLAAQTKRSADISEASLEAQTRPWVGIVGDLEIVNQAANTNGIMISFNYKLLNYGHSPATKVVSRFQLRAKVCHSTSSRSPTSAPPPRNCPLKRGEPLTHLTLFSLKKLVSSKK